MAGLPHSFMMRCDADWLRRVDDWRRKQPDIPSRAEAIRRLVDRTIAADDDTLKPSR